MIVLRQLASTVGTNISTGKICVANLAAAGGGLWASFTLKDWAQVIASAATAIWFCTQTVLAIKAHRRGRRK